MEDTNLAANVASNTAAAPTTAAGQVLPEIIVQGNRAVVTDFYVQNNVSSDQKTFKFKVFIRLNAKKITFKNVSFMHCIFDGCYFNHCVFDTCDFTGCRFLGSNLHQSAFTGCKFDFATFERSQIDDDILASEAPKEENLRMRFARSLRMNYQQIGDSKAVNKAITLELEATSIYLYKSWHSGETYYREKYTGLVIGLTQFAKWLEFWVLHFIWGNGESILKLLRSIFFCVIVIAIYNSNLYGDPLNIGFYWTSLKIAPAVFLGVLSPPTFTVTALSIIAGTRFVSIALLTALLVKRFSRR